MEDFKKDIERLINRSDKLWHVYDLLCVPFFLLFFLSFSISSFCPRRNRSRIDVSKLCLFFHWCHRRVPNTASEQRRPLRAGRSASGVVGATDEGKASFVRRIRAFVWSPGFLWRRRQPGRRLLGGSGEHAVLVKAWTQGVH